MRNKNYLLSLKCLGYKTREGDLKNMHMSANIDNKEGGYSAKQ